MLAGLPSHATTMDGESTPLFNLELPSGKVTRRRHRHLSKSRCRQVIPRFDLQSGAAGSVWLCLVWLGRSCVVGGVALW